MVNAYTFCDKVTSKKDVKISLKSYFIRKKYKSLGSLYLGLSPNPIISILNLIYCKFADKGVLYIKWKGDER